MSLSDDLMWNWFDLLSMKSNEEIAQLKHDCENGRNPRDAKVMLAKEIVTRFHNKEAADAAEQELSITKLIKEAGLTASSAEAGRNIEQGGVQIDGKRVTDKTLQLPLGSYTIKVGKRKWAKVHLT